ncbi:MAG: hypothetical protein KKF85_07420 [Gammaproteobacteria bacterium]|nr:hypothetical protein [Rhodocyclaceae bacterium]MBU3909436.1 hypothetical protein [Gammaproteobacteria bacterium]MBU3988596.1 hypothetical protein [Gammaproteobacteria bacterium]MBU4003614.1 hypothetical protein [Gammaproteobacteria bacterium]MBU4021972.1 hypothetical protein [Gammaproteobacteria bacterium]
MKKSLLTLFFSACLLSPVAFAGGGHAHGPKHGGITREVGDVTYELVARAEMLTLYVFERGKPLAAAGAKAEATLHAGSGKTTAMLVPAGDNRLVAQGSFRTGVGVRAEVLVSLPGRPAAKVNFRLK